MCREAILPFRLEPPAWPPRGRWVALAPPPCAAPAAPPPGASGAKKEATSGKLAERSSSSRSPVSASLFFPTKPVTSYGTAPAKCTTVNTLEAMRGLR